MVADLLTCQNVVKTKLMQKVIDIDITYILILQFADNML